MNEAAVLDPLILVADMFSASKLSALLFGIALLWILNVFVRRSGDSMMQRFPTRRFLILQIVTLLSFTLYLGGAWVLIVGVLQPPRELLLAIGGSAAVAVGFALKDVAASLVAGLILLFDRPFQVGDRVSFDNVYGEIVAIGLRSVRLQTLDDNLVTIPNSRFINDVASSGNAGALDMMVVTDFYLAIDADVARAEDLVRQVIVTSRYAYLKKPVTFAIEEIVLAQKVVLRLRAKAYVLDVTYEKAFQSDITRRAGELLRANGLPRPSDS